MSGKGQDDLKAGLPERNLGRQGWQEFRDLITEPEQRRLDALARRLDDPIQRAKEVGSVLPDALGVSMAEGGRIARALQPAIDTALKSSVRKNPKALADAIYPALGPAIRKAIATALMTMVQSLNQMLNQSFSWRGLQWRFEALRTKKSFGEIVLLHTLVFRVEQIFVIHRKNGLVLQHVSADAAAPRDPDLISGMLTAIQDFVKDSFAPQDTEQLDTLRMDGDHSIWIEQGSEAILAAVIRGTPPLGLRQTFRQLVEELHSKYTEILQNFQGDISPFAMIKPDLEDALAFQIQEHRPRISPLIWCGLLAVLTGAGFWLFTTHQTQRRWQAYLEILNREPGIVVQQTGRRDGSFFVRGRKDPLARDPAVLLATTALPPAKVQSQWEKFDSLDEHLVLMRAQRRLHPPDTVRLELTDGTLIVRGKAPHRWVTFLMRQAPAIAGIQNTSLDDVEDIELAELKKLLLDLEERAIFFEQGRSAIHPSQVGQLQTMLVNLQRIQSLQRLLDRTVQVAVVGHTDPTGPSALNQKLSTERAFAVQHWFIDKGVHPLLLIPVGGGVHEPMDQLSLPAALHPSRRVSFQPGLIGE